MALRHTHRLHGRLPVLGLVGLLGILTAGVLMSWQILVDTRHDLRADVVQQAQFAVQALNLERVQTFVQAPANQEQPEYQRLKNQLSTACAVFPKCQRLYLMGRRFDASSASATSATGTIFCIMDSALSNRLDQVQHGTLRDKALSAGCLHVFETRMPMVVGPVRDHSGARVSALAPLINPRDGSVLAVMGMDVDARLWNTWLAHAALPTIVTTLVLALLLLAGRVLLLIRRARLPGEIPEWMWRIEPALAAAVGLVLTISATLFVHMREKHDRNQAFVQLALGRTETIIETLRTLRGTELESLAKFYDHNPSISPEEYRSSFAYLTKNPAVQAWEWAPCVTAADKARFEADARAVNQAGFEIWQRDAEGKRVPATGRVTYFPVFQVAPLIGNERALGFDLGSESIRRAALEEALRTGLATATEPIVLVQETERQKGMLVYRPVFVEGDSRQLRGLVLAVLRMGTLLQSLSLDDATIQELFLLREGQPPELLAASREMQPASDEGLVMTRPFLGFGKTFLVTAHAGPGFLLRHPFRLRWVIALTGLGLTTTLTIILGTLLRRREDLERLVLRRTQELQQNEQKLRQLSSAVEQSPGAIVITNANGGIEYVNPRFEQLTGYSRDEALGRNLHILKSGLTSPETYKVLWTTIRSGNIWCGELQNRKKDGTLYWEYNVIAPLRDSAGHIVSFVAAKEDMTQRKRAEEEILRINQRLAIATARANDLAFRAEEANQAKSRFLANMSHEIRTPMNAIIGLTELLLLSPMNDEQHNHMRTISACGEALMTLINDILDLSKIEAGKLQILVETFDLVDLVEGAAKVLSVRAAAKEITISVDIDKNIPRMIESDPGRVRQILLNLLSNAVKFTEHGGVALRVSMKDQNDGTSLLRFEVRDSGIGIAPEVQPRLFEPFAQGDAVSTGKYGGTGLGLAISRLLVERLGGHIGASSEPNHGSMFWFEIPLIPAQTPVVWHATTLTAAAEKNSVHEPPGRALRILLVDDNPVNLEVATRQLKKLGYPHVDGAHNGRDALQAMARRQYDVLLLDCQMPEMDGFETTRHIRAQEAAAADHPHIQIIAMTANALEGDRKKCLAVGMDDYLSKPVRLADLERVVAQAAARLASRAS